MASSGPREIALQVMLQLCQQGRSLDDSFAESRVRDFSLEPRDLAMSRELAYGLCRWFPALSRLLSERLEKPLRAKDRDVELTLLLGLYQLLFMRVPAHAAVNESVRLVKRRRKHWAAGLINAVLRGVIREQIDLSDKSIESYPEWMRQQLQRDWDSSASSIMTAGNQRAPMTLRVDVGRHSREDVLQQMTGRNIEAVAHPVVETAINLESPCNVDQLPGFAEGRLSVQDAAAQLAAPLLDCQPGMRVLDACAAPGGKTAHLLQATDGLTLDALDIDSERLELVAQNLRRIDRDARLVTGDAEAPDSWYDGEPYDRILVDAPCSASGVIRRHPDIKLLRRESDIIALVERQRRILDGCWQLLKPGGKMLYSTCSMFKAENESQVAAFVARHPDCAELSLDRHTWGQAARHGRQILTGDHHMDGFYYALLQRNA